MKRIVIPEHAQAAVNHQLMAMAAMKDLLGWQEFDRLFLESQIPRRGGKRIRKKRLKRARAKWAVQSLLDAGAQIV